MAVSNDCVAFCDDNPPLSNPTPDFCTVEGNNPDFPDNLASDSESKVDFDGAGVEPGTAAPAEPERRSNRGRLLRSTKRNDFHFLN